VILTPVRRSARKAKQWNIDDISSVSEQLAECGYAYQARSLCLLLSFLGTQLWLPYPQGRSNVPATSGTYIICWNSSATSYGTAINPKP